MDFVKRINNAVNYIESHLKEEILPGDLSKIAACSYPAFQRGFSQLTGIPVSEYVRRRRLSLAAYDLQNTREKVIDIGLKYGYSSPDAFAAAFRRMHGLSPAAARRPGVRLSFYCRLSFALAMKGLEKMDYILTEKPAFKVMGKRRTTPYGGGTWAIVKSDGSETALKALNSPFFDLGLCFGFMEDGSNDYMCAVLWEGEDVQGFESFTYPPAAWITFEAEGTISGQTLYQTWQRIHQEFLPQSRYRLSGLPTVEKYTLWDEKNDACRVEISLPVTPKDGDMQ